MTDTSQSQARSSTALPVALILLQVVTGLIASTLVFLSSFDVGCTYECHWGLKAVATWLMAGTAVAVPLISIVLIVLLRKRTGPVAIGLGGFVVIVVVALVCMALLAYAVNKLFPA
jgi:hypothetical protein